MRAKKVRRVVIEVEGGSERTVRELAKARAVTFWNCADHRYDITREVDTITLTEAPRVNVIRKAKA